MSAIWVSHWLPFRPTNSVYARFTYSGLPPVDACEFENYKTVEDICRNPPKMFPNPLFCEWCFNIPGMFMSDPAFDINWSVDKYGRVIIPGNNQVVAPTLAEFLARMSLENSIWWSVVDNGLGSLARDNGTDPQLVWNMIQPVLSEKQLAYLCPYYEESKKWYTTYTALIHTIKESPSS